MQANSRRIEHTVGGHPLHALARDVAAWRVTAAWHVTVGRVAAGRVAAGRVAAGRVAACRSKSASHGLACTVLPSHVTRFPLDALLRWLLKVFLFPNTEWQNGHGNCGPSSTWPLIFFFLTTVAARLCAWGGAGVGVGAVCGIVAV